MFGKIIYIGDNEAHVAVNPGSPLTTNIMNLHVIFEDDKKKIIGEIEDIDQEIIKIRFLGEIVNNHFMGGVIRKPNFDSKIRLITRDEVRFLVGEDNNESFTLGVSPLYDDYPIRVNINDIFSSHMAIFGNSGSGKSCGVARILQNVFQNPKLLPYRANFLIFDAYGEYHNALQNINQYNPNLNFKFYTTNLRQTDGEKLCVPIWLFNLDDVALLLQATEHSQLPIIERMLKLTNIFAGTDNDSKAYKNHLIAKAMMRILYSDSTSSAKRNEAFSILATCSTDEFNLETPVQGVGYTRKFRDLFMIDTHGEFPESILLTQYITSYIDNDLEQYEPKELRYYTLEDMEKALEFTLISEGMLHNDKSYSDAITLKVRLHSLIISDSAQYLRYPKLITAENFIASLVSFNNRKAQIINFNLEDIEDWFAKVLVKVYLRLIFSFSKNLKERATIPFHIFIEEAHRYVQNDNDQYLIGYNIFERVAKEGRKYGMILNLISQRPVEISDTVISQCSNFLIFKLNHPRDVDYIRKMLPNISNEIVEKQKTLQPGTCMAFGLALKVPMVVKMPMPNPAPSSSSCDVVDMWKVN